MSISRSGSSWLSARLGVLAYLALVGIGFSDPSAAIAGSSSYRQVNLVSDQTGAARFMDPNLVNAWGLAAGPDTPWWVADNGTGLATIYHPSGEPETLVVAIPPHPGSEEGGAPTGVIYNESSDFIISSSQGSAPAEFIFAGEDGSLSGWSSSVDQTAAIIAQVSPSPTAVFKGIAMASDGGANYLYVTNFHDGFVERYDADFLFVGSFTDPDIPEGFAPFGIQNIDNMLIVTYAKQLLPDKKDDEAGLGNGYVDVFAPSGQLLQRFASQGTLNSPWGVAVAGHGFGMFSHDLLIGNFGDGMINAFNPETGEFMGQLPMAIDGLWSISFGKGPLSGRHNVLFFTAGPNGEADGLFGKIIAISR